MTWKLLAYHKLSTTAGVEHSLVKKTSLRNQFGWNSAHLVLSKSRTCPPKLKRLASRPWSSKTVCAFDWVPSNRNNSSKTFSPTGKYFFKHFLKLWWLGKLTNFRHECQSLRYSCRSTASDLLCSSGKTADAFRAYVTASQNSNSERAELWWLGKLTNFRHECQSLRYSCRSTASDLLC